MTEPIIPESTDTTLQESTSVPLDIKPPLVERNREREVQFEICVAVFNEVYSAILSINALLTEQEDFILLPSHLELLKHLTPLIQAYNKLMGTYLKTGSDFSDLLKNYNKEKIQISTLVEEKFKDHFSFSKGFSKGAEIAQYMKFSKNFVAGVSATHSYGNDLFTFAIQVESLQMTKDKLQKAILSESENATELQKIQERVHFLTTEVNRLRSRLTPSAEQILRDLKEGYYTEQSAVRTFVTQFGKYSVELFDQLFDSNASIKGEKILVMPKNADALGSPNSDALYESNFSMGLLKQWVKDSLENSYKAFRAYMDAQKPSAHFKSLSVKTGTHSMRNNLQDTDQFADNRPIPETFRIELQIFKESEDGVDYVVFAIADNGMGIEGVRKKFEHGKGGYDGKQHSSAVGMALLAKSVASYSGDMELRARTDGKRGTMSILRIPIEKHHLILNEKNENTLPSEDVAS